MSEVISLVNRNIKRYYRNKGAMIFSLLSVFIVSALYMFFLAQMQIDYVKETVGDIAGIENMINTWIIGGLLCIPAVSVPLIILCFKVDDTVDGTFKDLLVAPTKRSSIMLGYVVAAIIIGFAMTMISFVLGEFFILAKGGSLLSFVSTIKVISILFLMIVSFAGFEFFIVLFMKSNAAISVANSILNILLGFLLGLYVPIGMLGDGVANVIKSFPLLQGSSLIRQIIMKESLNVVFKNAPISVIREVREMYGIDIAIGNTVLQPAFIIALLILFGIMFYIASLVVLKYKKEK